MSQATPLSAASSIACEQERVRSRAHDSGLAGGHVPAQDRRAEDVPRCASESREVDGGGVEDERGHCLVGAR
ncbi:hypothetical protein Acr_24g0010780 [Actinidia rufa]|uniref:Uncharacterized protein n=1 Tax=Actinidia rufa TaxID=165716 RepID=A0A7J0GVT9_9ERIC|nr:hypothetical protein Acr_24g0010780 [Actinidia rufa]